MYGMFTYIWLVNVGEYTTHGSYGYGTSAISTAEHGINFDLVGIKTQSV